ncbi:hypothetical protein KGA66_23230 [Actinocrinis puniceicyclus]|uniref:Uncharacterized protein n=1 Tax=Actinocrinis puniceicyclus TaxID=977794 RepID=A0A8J8BE48_9ACTN|nr:hypothetical protein [Actinocrinis puniceicyclus]MBS2965978.1 hypothetical protein [Actinocrinis puniceicyclus]
MSSEPPAGAAQAPGPAQPGPAGAQPDQEPNDRNAGQFAGGTEDEASQRTGFASAAAGNPNRSSGYLGHQYSAQRQFFGGSLQEAVMGDKNVNTFYFGATDRRTLLHHPLSAEALEETLAFVAPRDYPRVAAFASGRPLTVVIGAEGSGRAAAAVHLLANGTGRRAIHVVHPDTDLTLLPGALPKGTGIVLADITARAAASLDDFALRQLVDSLTAAGQKMIVTATDGLAWGARAMAAHCVPLGPAPDPAAVVEKQFRRRFGPSEQAAARALLGRRDVRELIAAHTGGGRPMSDAALLATLLADCAGDPERMAANAGTGMKGNVSGEIERWFEELGDRRQDQFYAIALAVLNGLPNEKIADAGRQLGRLLAPEAPERRDEQKPDPFTGGNRLRLQRVNAVQIPRQRSQGADESGELVVRYLSPDRPRRLLNHVWEQYDEERGALTRWLRELGASPLEDVHIGTGVAVAALAMSSYEHVFQTIVRPWARSRDADQQDAAAVTLQTLGGDPRFAARIKSLIEEWAHPDAEVSLQASAARAYGSRFGAQHIDEAARVLSQLAEIDRWPVTRAVARSLTELIATDTPAVTARVFNLLGSWVSGRNPSVRSTGRLAFLFAAADLVVQVPEGVSGQRAAEWPALLRLDLEPGYSPIIRYLWANALGSADLHESARDVLTAWAESLETNRRGCDALARMLAGCASTDRTRLILHRLAGRWAGRGGGGPAPRAGALLAAAAAS